MKLHRIFLVLALIVVSTPLLAAHTINWGNSVGSSLYSSTGSALDDSYTFELGSFGSFVPTEFNMTEWLSNWKVFDRAAAPAGSGWNSGAGYFTSSSTLLGNGTSSEAVTWSLPGYTFGAGEQGYIWVYNTQTLTPESLESPPLQAAASARTARPTRVLMMRCGCIAISWPDMRD